MTEKKATENIPYRADVCLQPVRGNLQNSEFSNTVYLLVSHTHAESVNKILLNVPDCTHNVSSDTSSGVLYSVRVNKLISFSAVIEKMVTEMKKIGLVVIKS